MRAKNQEAIEVEKVILSSRNRAEVNTFSQRVLATRRGVLVFLFIFPFKIHHILKKQVAAYVPTYLLMSVMFVVAHEMRGCQPTSLF